MVLILLCTFKSNNIINSSRNNTEERINDYYSAIKNWLKENHFDKVIIVENSGFHAQKITQLVIDHSFKKSIEFLQFQGNSFDKKLGKGYGVFELLKYVIDNSELYKSENKFAIVTGRYFINNYTKILMQSTNFELISDFQKSLTYAFNPIFISSSLFIEKYLMKELINSNDFEGIHFEHCLAIAAHRAIADGIKWELLCEVPIIIGISGTSNQPYYKNFVHRILIKYYSKVKYLFFKFAR